MSEKKYGFSRELSNIDLDTAQAKVVEALAAEGFGILTEIDVQKTLEAKLDVDFHGYRILGACNPQLAYTALTEEPDIGLLLPCNVVLQEARNGGVSVGIVAPKAMFELVDNQAIAGVATEADARLRRVLDAL